MYSLTKWLIIAAFLTGCNTAAAQTLTIAQANELARRNYPLTKQKDLIRKTESLNIANISKGYLPQLSFNGQASYQSDVTRVDIPLPGFKIDAPEKDQYRITADINQLIYDGGATREQKKSQQLNAAVQEQEVEVELHQLKDRINTIFLGILFIDEQLRQNELISVDINTGLKSVEAQYENGVAFRSNVNSLKAEQISIGQRVTELQATRKSLLETLSLFINEPLSASITLEKPHVTAKSKLTVSRPELRLFMNQQQLLTQQHKIITAKNLPRASIFLQGGYGRPGLNLLKNEFDLFYTSGIRVNWSLAGLYTKKNDRQLININHNIVDLKRDVFMMNTNSEIIKQQNEIDKLQQLIISDEEIVALRNSITQSAKAQLQNGVITANDYLQEVNAEDQARQSKIAHEILLLQAKIKLQTIIGL